MPASPKKPSIGGKRFHAAGVPASVPASSGRTSPGMESSIRLVRIQLTPPLSPPMPPEAPTRSDPWVQEHPGEGVQQTSRSGPPGIIGSLSRFCYLESLGEVHQHPIAGFDLNPPTSHVARHPSPTTSQSMVFSPVAAGSGPSPPPPQARLCEAHAALAAPPPRGGGGGGVALRPTRLPTMIPRETGSGVLRRSEG